MRHDPDKHHRQSIRLKYFDYTRASAYFVTVCTHDRECIFEDIVLRRVAEAAWLNLPRHHPTVTLDEWALLPNHLHGIIVMGDDCHGKGEAFPQRPLDDAYHGANAEARPDYQSLGNASPLRRQSVHLSRHSLGALVGNFKSVTARRINAFRKTLGAPVWQRNYYEHIIRDDADLNRVREYIINNPANCNTDENNPRNAKPF